MWQTIGKIVGRIAIATGVIVVSSIAAECIMDAMHVPDPMDYAYKKAKEREAVPKHYEVYMLDEDQFEVK